MSDFVNFNELVDSIVIEKDYGANRNAATIQTDIYGSKDPKLVKKFEM
ncbi:hypothetical protein QU768_13660 [Proteus mirabilis]|nr:hypothetical protein [Proteus mirabilis]MDM9219606.1 hypothetical protein [Proteus mirabilis]